MRGRLCGTTVLFSPVVALYCTPAVKSVSPKQWGVFSRIAISERAQRRMPQKSGRKSNKRPNVVAIVTNREKTPLASAPCRLISIPCFGRNRINVSSALCTSLQRISICVVKSTFSVLKPWHHLLCSVLSYLMSSLEQTPEASKGTATFGLKRPRSTAVT